MHHAAAAAAIQSIKYKWVYGERNVSEDEDGIYEKLVIKDIAIANGEGLERKDLFHVWWN
jgi:hypothetical protein